MKPLISLCLLLSLLTGPGCGADRPAADPPPPGFAEYYAGEIFLAEKAKLLDWDGTSLAARIDSLRRRHGVTVEQRDSLLAYCQASLPRWEAFLQEVLANLESLGSAAKGRGGIGTGLNDPNGTGGGDTGTRRQ